MMPCKDDEERQGWKRDKKSGEIIATAPQFKHRRVLDINGQYRDVRSDVKRGQNPEAEDKTEAIALRSRPRPIS